MPLISENNATDNRQQRKVYCLFDLLFKAEHTSALKILSPLIHFSHTHDTFREHFGQRVVENLKNYEAKVVVAFVCFDKNPFVSHPAQWLALFYFMCHLLFNGNGKLSVRICFYLLYCKCACVCVPPVQRFKNVTDICEHCLLNKSTSRKTN